MKRMFAAVVTLLLLAGCAGQGKGDAKDGLATLDFREVIAGAKEKVFPAVVYIKCIRESHEEGKKISGEVSGSGVVISPRGEVVTNWHVVDKAIEVRCLLFDGRAMHAEILGKDKDTDLALLKLKRPENDKPIPSAMLGDSTILKEGQFVMAMGAPWGLSRSVSIGIISCARRYLPKQSEYNLWLQTDASISPGNSGGPLVNTDGVVIGINTLGVTYGGDMGFAIPSNVVQDVVGRIRKDGKVEWSWTGLQVQALRDFNRDMYFEGTEGVIVAGTDPDSPARKAGLLPRDRILKLNGDDVTALDEEDLPAVRRLLGNLEREKDATLELLRGEEAVTVQLRPREKGKVEGEELDCPRWDMTVKAINQFDNPYLYFQKKVGVFIFGVKYPGNASNAGLFPQDIVLKIDGRPVETLQDVKDIHKELIESVEKKWRVVFTIVRNGLLNQVVLDFSRDYEKE